MLGVVKLGFISGCLGTVLGGVIALFIKSDSKKIYTFILEFAGGLMFSVVCFELLPESMHVSNIVISLIGFLVGCFLMMLLEDSIYKINNNLNKNYLMGIMIFLSIAIHNFPEGLAIGASYNISQAIGYSIFLAILLHDIPEGMGIVLPMKKAVNKNIGLLLYPFISGIPTAIGAGIGYYIGQISNNIIGFSLSFAAGVMMYVVLGDIIPESKNTYKGRLPIIGNLFGIIIGIIVSNI